MKNPIRNETSLVLVVAVIFTAVAIPVLSGFLEPSQPPAVGAVKIGDPSENAPGSPKPDTTESRPADDDKAQRRRPAPRQAAPAPARQSAASPPGDDAAEDDGGED